MTAIADLLRELGPPEAGREWGHWCPCGGYTKIATAPTPNCQHCGAPFIRPLPFGASTPIAVTRLSVSAFGFEIVVDPTLPAGVVRLVNADGSGIQYDTNRDVVSQLVREDT